MIKYHHVTVFQEISLLSKNGLCQLRSIFRARILATNADATRRHSGIQASLDGWQLQPTNNALRTKDNKKERVLL